jgi:hypothetical protein
MQKGADFIVVFFCCCHSDQALDRMQATQGGADVLSIFTAVAISQKYVRVFLPGRPLMPTTPKSPSWIPGCHCDNHPDLGYRGGFPVTNHFLRSVHR